ncbi:hypothetical protein VE02_02934 [Pseudogymnoascus sp. 03VT05]|nr:hypothetical protein VE02_02934 [Pseudogymnoascus sp. 03VT05]
MATRQQASSSRRASQLSQQRTAVLPPLDTRGEMFQKGQHGSFFDMKALAPRPMSSSTEMYDTDFEDDGSEIEEGEYSPRISINSAGRRSQTTLSSFEELPTPKSNSLHGFDFQLQQAQAPRKSVEGPKGPHLFRISQEVAPEEEYYLTMSPVTPRYAPSSRPDTAFRVPSMPYPQPELKHRPISTLTAAVTKLNKMEVAMWTPRQVARWMYHAGFEPAIVEKFEENDISGEILTTLKFEDLRELDIQSFGQRHKLWAEIHTLRGDAVGAPTSPTEIDCGSSDEDERTHKKSKPRRKHKKSSFEDIISPLESVSIVGIEQLMPKPHKCSKGDNCSRWKKQQRLIQQFKMGHPVSPDGGMILIAGDPGNPFTAEAVRPFSEAQPSVVASSDLLGPGEIPSFSHLDPAQLAALATRDPQDNVKQFLNFQHVEQNWSSEEPATPPYEMFPSLPASLQHTAQPTHPLPNLRNLPKLAIPPPRPPRSASAMAFSPGPMDRAEALSPDLRSARQPCRFGTPASDMDVPVTAINLGPISRDASQSVPPNMSYRNNVPAAGPPLSRSASRSSRRPSYQAGLPRLDEDPVVAPPRPHRSSVLGPISPPRPVVASNAYSPVRAPAGRSTDDLGHQGWMRKRKTRMLRHEWHEHHFTLRGTRLAMHKDERAREVLESIDVDDYAVACSSLASSKINTAFKAMNIKLGKKEEEGAFAFQLIPAAVEKAEKLKKNRESGIFGSSSVEKDKVKTHHFAVKSRDERIDWMRELMLAKALKQKGEGFEINVNGNMI